MLGVIIFINLVLVTVDCQVTEDNLHITDSVSQSQTVDDLLHSSTNSNDVTADWQTPTSENPFAYEYSTISSSTNHSSTNTGHLECSSDTIRDILDETKRNFMAKISDLLTKELNAELELLEGRLSKLTCLTDRPSLSLSPVELPWQIYEMLRISLTGWSRVFDEPYSRATRTEDLDQLGVLCRNEVIVAATFNESVTLAAVGPADVLSLNTSWNKPQQFGQVYWYRTSGKSFGFSPTPAIRQTSGDNEDLNSPLRLSWLLDQNAGGYRAGSTRALYNDSLWHKVIYCN